MDDFEDAKVLKLRTGHKILTLFARRRAACRCPMCGAKIAPKAFYCGSSCALQAECCEPVLPETEEELAEVDSKNGTVK